MERGLNINVILDIRMRLDVGSWDGFRDRCKEAVSDDFKKKRNVCTLVGHHDGMKTVDEVNWCLQVATLPLHRDELLRLDREGDLDDAVHEFIGDEENAGEVNIGPAYTGVCPVADEW